MEMEKRHFEIHEERTAEAQSNEKYVNYLKWLKAEGATYTHMNYPVAFGNSGVVGVQASQDIPPYTTIMKIPNKLVISVDRIFKGEISFILRKYPEVFEKHHDADYLAMTVYIIYEMIKGPKSIHYNHFLICSHSDIPAFWPLSQIEELQEQKLIYEIRGYKIDLHKQWELVSSILCKYPEQFPEERYDFSMFEKTYSLLVTRSFGHELPCTMFCPLADAFNHSSFHTSSLYVGMDTQSKPTTKPPKAKIVKKVTKEKGTTEKGVGAWKKYMHTIGVKPPKIKIIKKDRTVVGDVAKEFEELSLNEREIWDIVFPEIDDDEIFEEEEEDNEEEEEEGEEEEGEGEGEDWWDPKDDVNTYFYVESGAMPIPKGAQLHTTYANRNNAYFISNYGFIEFNNPASNYSFRLWRNLNPKASIVEERLQKLMVDDAQTSYVDGKLAYLAIDCEEDFENEFKMQTWKIAIKRHSLSTDLMEYLRYHAMDLWEGANRDQLLLTVPVDHNFELSLIEFAYKILQLILKVKFKTTLEEDLILMANVPLADIRMRLCIQYRIEVKEIIVSQIQLFRVLERILRLRAIGKSVKEAYMEELPDLETKQEMMLNRRRLKDYLKQLSSTY